MTRLEAALSAENAELRSQNHALRLIVERLQGDLLRAAQDADDMAADASAGLRVRAEALRRAASVGSNLALQLEPAKQPLAVA